MRKHPHLSACSSQLSFYSSKRANYPRQIFYCALSLLRPPISENANNNCCFTQRQLHHFLGKVDTFFEQFLFSYACILSAAGLLWQSSVASQRCVAVTTLPMRLLPFSSLFSLCLSVSPSTPSTFEPLSSLYRLCKPAICLPFVRLLSLPSLIH
jgi:hypothetical protein